MLNRPEQVGAVRNRAWRVIRENGMKDDAHVRDDNSASFIQSLLSGPQNRLESVYSHYYAQPDLSET